MKKDSVLFSSNRHDWRTPREFLRALEMELICRFDVDAAASAENTLCERFISEEEDALAIPEWADDNEEWVFCNPPYKKSAEFVKKMLSLKLGQIAMLVAARTDTPWFQEALSRCHSIYFIQGRLRFVGAKSSAPFPSAVLIYVPWATGPAVCIPWNLTREQRGVI